MFFYQLKNAAKKQKPFTWEMTHVYIYYRGESVRATTFFLKSNCIYNIVAYLFSNCIKISLVYSKEPSRCRHSTQYFLTSLSVVRCLNIS